ncbi:hypothetical protein GP486_000619 [Trichoglossum hirsutum]|uniref:DNA 3'-5' helicase n=1 Tax=Trichoglossum hirsutum TaxID=265104 RepID=A0A9P8LIK8_9PEZI|nr:hypothetical protein GP486_000619 [Trichoglossum hirsutum]
MTRKERADYYQKMVSGGETLESWSVSLGQINAEIGLGTITDAYSARKWLESSFLYVRLKQNPNYYKLEDGSNARDLDEMIEDICNKNVGLLEKEGLTTLNGSKYKCTEFGDAMSKYYLKFETMRTLLAVKEKARLSDIVGIIFQARKSQRKSLGSNADEVRHREKSLYREINRASGIKFPIKVDIALAAHKASLILQSELGGVEFPGETRFLKFKPQFSQDRITILQHVQRLIRCIVDCKLHQRDSVSVRNGLELARSLGGRAWDNSPLYLKQISGIGPVAVRKLVAAGVKNIEMLEATEPYRIEMIMSRNPPFGHEVLAAVKEFPKLRVSAAMVGKDVKNGGPVQARFRAVVGCDNDKAPVMFGRKFVYVIFLAETSDGELLDFRPGTLKYVEVNPSLDPSLFPAPTEANSPGSSETNLNRTQLLQRYGNNYSGFRTALEVYQEDEDEFRDDSIDDSDLAAAAGDLEFEHIDRYADKRTSETRKNTLANRKSKQRISLTGQSEIESDEDGGAPRRLGNGKWACNHRCKDKTKCKHMCCRDGLDKPAKQPRKKTESALNDKNVPSLTAKIASKSASRPGLAVAAGGVWKGDATHSTDIEIVDLANGIGRGNWGPLKSKEYWKLDILHSNTRKSAPVSSLSKRQSKFSYAVGGKPDLSFAGIGQTEASGEFNSEYEPVEGTRSVCPPERRETPPLSSSFGDSGLIGISTENPFLPTHDGAENTGTLLNSNGFGLEFYDIGEVMEASSPATISSADEELPGPPAKPVPTQTEGDFLFVTDSPVPDKIARKRKWDCSESSHDMGHDSLEYGEYGDNSLNDEENLPKRQHNAEHKPEQTSISITYPEKSPQPDGDLTRRKDQRPSTDPLGGIDPELLAFFGDCVEFIN